jgi:thienamycin biosynthesis protein ThnO
MLWKHGRTCTGLTSVIVDGRGREFSERMAERLALEVGGDFAANVDRLPLFPVARARSIDDAIEHLVRRGEAEDVTRRVTGRPRLLFAGGRAMLMPTVLWIKQAQSRAFGLELPFPFVTIAEAPDQERMLKLARDTLILSVIGGDQDLLRRLCYDSSIRKVLSGAHVERGYHFLDPHEGYMADFLYQKKAVFL